MAEPTTPTPPSDFVIGLMRVMSSYFYREMVKTLDLTGDTLGLTRVQKIALMGTVGGAMDRAMADAGAVFTDDGAGGNS